MHPSLIAELVDLLASGNIEADEKNAIVLQVEAAPQEFDWASSDTQACSIALTAEMHRHCASGDKLDEIHEEVRQILGEGFPEFPCGMRTHTDYFTWMEQQLSEWSAGAYALLSIDLPGAKRTDRSCTAMGRGALVAQRNGSTPL